MKTLAEISTVFPGLDCAASKVTSLETASYNCIAYAAGDYSRWWWPDAFGMMYWPLTAPKLEILPSFQSAFESLGYVLCGDDTLDPRLEKIAIYSTGTSPTHASRQLVNGAWSSKLGRSEDISHNFTGLNGGCYGSVAFIMCRPR